MQIGIIGGGRVGLCLAQYLLPSGCLVGVTCAHEEHSIAVAEKLGIAVQNNAGLLAQADVLLITVPDRKIVDVAEELAQLADKQHISVVDKVFLHCSGSLGLEPLASLVRLGAHVGSLHPLQSFAGGKVNLAGVYMALDGDAAAMAAAEQIADILGGHTFAVPAKERAAYHAAACICSNYTVALQALASQLMSRWTGDTASAWAALKPLFAGTSSNLLQAENPGPALTGPIARGDTNTVVKHLGTLPQDFLSAYCSLGLATTDVAQTNGTIDAKTADALRALLVNGGQNND